MQKRKYKYYSGNIVNITKLDSYIQNRRQSSAFDQIIFLSINSTFSMPEHQEYGKGWFKVGYEKLCKMVGYKRRQLVTIIKKFISLGLLEKTRPIIGSKNEACLRITEKAKYIVGLSKHVDKTIEHVGKDLKTTDKSLFFTQDRTSTNANITLAYNEERENEKESVINIISEKKSTYVNERYKSYEQEFNLVGERLEESDKKIIARTVENLKKDNSIKLSKPPQELFLEFVYQILHKSFMPTASSLKHRLNILADLIRKGVYKTPWGFHKYSDMGQEMAYKKQREKERYEQKKREECGDRYKPESQVAAISGNQSIKSRKKITENVNFNDDQSVLNLELSSAIGEIKQLSKMLKYQEGIRPQLAKAEAKRDELLENLKAVKASKQFSNQERAPEPHDEDLAIYEQWQWA